MRGAWCVVRGREFVDGEFAFAEMVGLFAGFDKTGAIGIGETQAVLDDGKGGEACCVLRVA